MTALKIELPETEIVLLSQITPYWRNPRRIPPEAVDGVATSLDSYGDAQPIVVDTGYVIIVGHTRYQALTQLGVEETEVYVASDLTAEKVKEYRLADNRLGEMTAWDHGALVMELREWESKLLENFFPEMDLEIDAINAASPDVTAGDVAKATREVEHIKDPGELLVTEVECPACLEFFQVSTASLPGLSRTDLEQLSAVAAASDDGRVE